MGVSCSYISYESTGYFSKLVLDYIAQKETVQPFYKHPVTVSGIEAAINDRKAFNDHRNLLFTQLSKQYEGLQLNELQEKNLVSLLDENTFTVCTAHQPNIFTGPLYFIYKILHTIKLAQSLNQQLPQYKFVPFYYMGSEDADLDELGHINLNGEKLEWKTKQTGAVGRMKVDKALVELIERISGELSVDVFGGEIIELFKNAYKVGVTIQEATLRLVDTLFKSFGLLILVPDNADLKRIFNGIVKKELTEEFSHPLVEETSALLNKHYKAQASGREINLFYLVDNVRERIVKDDKGYWVSRFNWNEDEILKELEDFPERFSANVILRGVFQETILPNVAFIGGGGEIAYWLQLKKVFEAAGVPYPVLIVRNSFLIFNRDQKVKIDKLGFKIEDFFRSEKDLLDEIVKRNSDQQLNLNSEKKQLENLYNQLNRSASAIDSSLEAHVIALQKQAFKKVEELEKKMFKAERKKFSVEQNRIHKIKATLFPSKSLQERVDNFSSYYAKYGKDWMEILCEASLTLEQQFAIIEVENK